MTEINCQFCLRKKITTGNHCRLCDICDECYWNVHDDYKYIIDVIMSDVSCSNVFKENRKSTFLQVLLFVYYDLFSNDTDNRNIGNTISYFRKIWKCPFCLDVHLNFNEIQIVVNWLINQWEQYGLNFLHFPLFCMGGNIDIIFERYKIIKK
jgi:hypothetical protein